MVKIKNEHIVYAYMPLRDGGNLVLVGITDIGWEYLGQESGNYLTASPPAGQFQNITGVWIVRAKDKAEVHKMIYTIARQAGVEVIIPS